MTMACCILYTIPTWTFLEGVAQALATAACSSSSNNSNNNKQAIYCQYPVMTRINCRKTNYTNTLEHWHTQTHKLKWQCQENSNNKYFIIEISGKNSLQQIWMTNLIIALAKREEPEPRSGDRMWFYPYYKIIAWIEQQIKLFFIALNVFVYVATQIASGAQRYDFTPTHGSLEYVWFAHNSILSSVFSHFNIACISLRNEQRAIYET